ncbi:MAG: hypothetical protein NT027_06980 [Proteobacteria bacterium]|nr:hypothetical protein [Pseudomonadota bacterium]
MNVSRLSKSRLFPAIFFIFFSANLAAQELKLLPIEASSPKEDLRKKIFTTRISERRCEILSRDPVPNISVDSELQSTVKDLLSSLQTRNDKSLLKMFNPRLKVKLPQISNAFSKLAKITGPNPQITNYRTVALNSPTGAGDGIECEDTGVLVHPLYGYPLTIGLWFQALGDEEVARIFIELVPSKTDWTIGAWHIQQWSHNSMDFSQWYELGLTEAKAGRKAGAFIAADLSAKLLDGGGFLTFPVMNDAIALRDQQMTREVWHKEIQSTFLEDKVIYTSTLFVKKGAGVLIRFGIKGEKSASDISSHCQNSLAKALDSSWGKVIQGIRCGYNLPAEKPDVEGVLGSMYVNKESLVIKNKP